MSPSEREDFLAGVHIGVLSVNSDAGAPVSAPVWYRYADGVVEIVTAATTRKVALLRKNPAASLCVQREEYPPSYVTVEGEVSIDQLPDGVVEAIAARYLGADGGATFAAASRDDTLLRFHIRNWRTTDFARMTS